MGGFLYATVASFALGLILSTLRWFVLDPLHYRTGIPRPRWNFAKLQEHIDAFQIAVDYHYRFYQSYGNGLILLVTLTVFPQPLAGLLPGSTPVHRLCLALLAALFFLASRDALRNYHDRASALRDKSRHVKERSHDQRFKDRKAAHSAAQGQPVSKAPRTLHKPAPERSRPTKPCTP